MYNFLNSLLRLLLLLIIAQLAVITQSNWEVAFLLIPCTNKQNLYFIHIVKRQRAGRLSRSKYSLVFYTRWVSILQWRKISIFIEMFNKVYVRDCITCVCGLQYRKLGALFVLHSSFTGYLLTSANANRCLLLW